MSVDLSRGADIPRLPEIKKGIGSIWRDAIEGIKARNIAALTSPQLELTPTGNTPYSIENRMDDVKSALKWLKPDVLGKYLPFTDMKPDWKLISEKNLSRLGLKKMNDLSSSSEILLRALRANENGRTQFDVCSTSAASLVKLAEKQARGEEVTDEDWGEYHKARIEGMEAAGFDADSVIGGRLESMPGHVARVMKVIDLNFDLDKFTQGARLRLNPSTQRVIDNLVVEDLLGDSQKVRDVLKDTEKPSDDVINIFEQMLDTAPSAIVLQKLYEGSFPKDRIESIKPDPMDTLSLKRRGVGATPEGGRYVTKEGLEDLIGDTAIGISRLMIPDYNPSGKYNFRQIEDSIRWFTELQPPGADNLLSLLDINQKITAVKKLALTFIELSIQSKDSPDSATKLNQVAMQCVSHYQELLKQDEQR